MALDVNVMREDLAKELGIETLPVEEQERLIDMAIETLLQEIHLQTVEKLGEAGGKEYEALADREGSEKEINDFLRARIPDYDNFIAKIIMDFKRDMKKA